MKHLYCRIITNLYISMLVIHPNTVQHCYNQHHVRVKWCFKWSYFYSFKEDVCPWRSTSYVENLPYIIHVYIYRCRFIKVYIYLFLLLLFYIICLHVYLMLNLNLYSEASDLSFTFSILNNRKPWCCQQFSTSAGY